MTAIDCVVGVISATTGMPAAPVALEGKSIDRIFREGSRQDIRLRMDYRMDEEIFAGLSAVESLDLHRAISQLAGNPPDAPKVSRIAVVLAGTYRPHPAAFGVMFDWGRPNVFDPIPTSEFTALPREGCAVFLDAIRRSRASDEDYASQVAFTTVHELGHVFNLQHRLAPLSYMAPSRLESTYVAAEGAFQFHPDDQDLLSQCSTSKFIWPGGSGFGDLGPLAALDLPESAVRNSPVSVDIAIEPREFWPFEPVELEVSVAVSPGTNQNVSVPDVIDPGYEQFALWIEDPCGERRRFRSPRRYCWAGETREISEGSPFCRDISVYLQSGGYTFRSAGIHRTWVELQLGAGNFLKSNVTEFNVLPSRPRDPEYCHLRRVLLEPRNLWLLYFRRFGGRRRDLTGLVEFARKFGHHSSGATVRYALGRALLKEASLLRSPSRARSRRRDSDEHLKIAAESPRFGNHGRQVARQLLQRELPGLH